MSRSFQRHVAHSNRTSGRGRFPTFSGRWLPALLLPITWAADLRIANARAFSISTFQDLSNDTKNTPMRGVLPLVVELWTFGSPGGLQIPNFSKCWASPPHLAKLGLRHLHYKKPFISTFLFVRSIYAQEVFFFFNHHSFLGKSSINHSLVGTCPHHGDMLVGPIFVLTHFQALHCFTWFFSSCIFISFIDNIHIIGLASIVCFYFEHVFFKLVIMGLVV